MTMDGNITTSVWRLTPTWRDHDALVICNAVNPSLANVSASVENRTRLNVHCKWFKLDADRWSSVCSTTLLLIALPSDEAFGCKLAASVNAIYRRIVIFRKLQPNDTSDRIALKRLKIEPSKSYRLV